MTKTKRRVISFELPDTVYSLLEKDAADRGGSSIHLRAREIVIESLSNPQMIEALERLDAVDSEVHQMGDLIRKVAFAVLVVAGGKPSKDANAWIRENMPRAK